VNPFNSGQPEGGPSLRVLCVDVNRDVADSAVMLFNLVGFEARACYHVRSALLEGEAFRPGVCLIDLHIPGMDGDELAARIRRACDPPPVLVAVTAMSNEQSSTRIVTAGF
jgi:two-component system OmpR family response regulator